MNTKYYNFISHILMCIYNLYNDKDVDRITKITLFEKNIKEFIGDSYNRQAIEEPVQKLAKNFEVKDKIVINEDVYESCLFTVEYFIDDKKTIISSYPVENGFKIRKSE